MRHLARLPPDPVTLHPSSGRLGIMHIAGMLAWWPYQIIVGQPPQWHTLAAICRRYNILHPEIHDGSTHSFVHDVHRLGFLWSSIEPGQVHLCQIQDWHPVFEKVETRLGGWRARLLLCGGNLVLLKVVLATLSTYYTSIFKMSAGVKRVSREDHTELLLAKSRA